jgi:adenylyl cyclase-associated protein
MAVDGSKKCGVLVENVVSTLDVVNSKSITLQITGKAPTVAIDKSDGLQLYLSKECKDIEVFTAKSSALNILTPSGEDYTELPVPEQLKTTVENGKLVSVAVEHKG